MKRKKTSEDADREKSPVTRPRKLSKTESGGPIQVQVVVGTYDKVLHGLIATVPDPDGAADFDEHERVIFRDNFKFNAHRSSIRCLALSPLPPPDAALQSRRIFLASGGTDGCINVYQIDSMSRPSANGTLPSPRNEEVGSLVHHSSYITVLDFASRSKLLSGADDNTIAISRTRDWTVVSTLKAPIPRAVGRPSGDTAPDGATPSGVNDFSIHPSKKLMISVGKGEKCMRLWNLVTGKKAGVLTFDRSLLQSVGEGRHSRGEGSRVEWNSSGDEFAVVFERGAAVFSMDCNVKAVLLPDPLTKIHRVRFLPETSPASSVLVASTEDGRLVFATSSGASQDSADPSAPPSMKILGEVSDEADDVARRIKDFEIVRCSVSDRAMHLLVVTVGSDGAIRLWNIKMGHLEENSQADWKSESDLSIMQGSVLGTYLTDSRITCLKAFLMSSTANTPTREALSLLENVSPEKNGEAPGANSDDSEEEFQGLGSDDD